MHELNLTVAICAATVLALGMISERVEGLPISRPLLALGIGIVAGPQVLGLLTPEEWPSGNVILKEAAGFTVAIAVMGIALRTPREDLVRLAQPVMLLISLGMLVMWLASSGIAAVMLGLSPALALALGAVVTPTDPVVASSIVTGVEAERSLPGGLRSTLSLESGANDGLAYLLVLLPVLALEHATLAGAGTDWFARVVAVGVVLAIVLGGALGSFCAVLLRAAHRQNWIERHSLLGASVALSLLSVALARLAGSDGILAAFVAGIAFNLGVDRREDFEQHNVQGAMSELFSLPVFVILGAALPFGAWVEGGWGLAGFAFAVVLIRRPLALALVGPLLGRQIDAPGLVYLGWFGPIGIAAVYYALLVEERTGESELWHAASLAVTASVLLHGLTSGPGLRLYRRYGEAPKN